jgi:hypothetical protein
VQHLAIFVPWQAFIGKATGDINDIWERQRVGLSKRISHIVDNIQLLRRSAEDVKSDARQWAAWSGESDSAADAAESGTTKRGDAHTAEYRPGSIGSGIRLIDVLRKAVASKEITAGSEEIARMIGQLCRFQVAALDSEDELRATILPDTILAEHRTRAMDILGEPVLGTDVPRQEQIKSIKSQQISLSREREKMIQGMQTQSDDNSEVRGAAVCGVLDSFGEQNMHFMAGSPGPSIIIRFGFCTSFFEAGRQLAGAFTLNRRQSIAFRLICRQLDRVRRDECGTPQLCEFIGGEGGTGKSRIIAAVAELFARMGQPHRLLVTATSGTAAANINGITIHSACKFSKDTTPRGGRHAGVDGFAVRSSTGLRIDVKIKMDWQEKYLLVIDEVSMLGARTLYAVNEQLCRFRESTRDFGGIPIVLFCGDFHQFRPVQERSILLPSGAIPWDEENSFTAEQRHQHDKAHALWKRFTTVVILKEQVRAAGDPRLRRLLTRIRQGVQDQSDLDLLNSTCYEEGRRIPWDLGITVVTPLNRNRWNLNIEGALFFQEQRQTVLRIFISEHKWTDGEPTEEEALMILSHGDDSGIPVPAVFMFVQGMPVVVNQNTYQGLKVVNGARFTALDVILDKAYPGHCVSANTIIHFGPPAAILLEGETTSDFRFVNMPPGTILLTPISTKIECQRKRPWQQNDVTRRGLPCAAAFACTDYKVQSRTLDRVALELRGAKTTKINGEAVPSQCDPYSLYVQLSRCSRLDGIMLLSKVRERDFVGNKVADSMVAAEERLDLLSEATIRDAESWDWSGVT